jgi:hypothetical protein
MAFISESPVFCDNIIKEINDELEIVRISGGMNEKENIHCN